MINVFGMLVTFSTRDADILSGDMFVNRIINIERMLKVDIESLKYLYFRHQRQNDSWVRFYYNASHITVPGNLSVAAKLPNRTGFKLFLREDVPLCAFV